MRIFGLEISRIRNEAKALSPPDRGWHTIFDWKPGMWQTHTPNPDDPESVTAYWAVFSCATFIASDFSKCAPVVMRQDGEIWKRTLNRRPLLKRPNGYQTGIEFFFSWAMSKLLRGNTYALKQRNANGFIEAMHILDPLKCEPLVSDSGQVFYGLNKDNLAGVTKDIIVPASEIIHDKMYPLYHPLVGIAPLYACGQAAAQGISIQSNSRTFFGNRSIPAGILTAPGKIGDETAKRLSASWKENYSGRNYGNVAVLGDDLKFQQMTITAEDAQLIEQLKMTAEMVCACFHFPGYKIGVGQMPTVNNASVLNQKYFDECLHPMFESAEAWLDIGLELPDGQELWFDVANLLRMDPEARYKSYNDAIKGGWMAPNEARRKEDMEDMDGGDTPYLQQQNYSLAALAKRDAQEDPFGADRPPEAGIAAHFSAIAMKSALDIRGKYSR